MPQVKVKCTEGRMVAGDRYLAGQVYPMDAERAGKYGSYFEATNLEDASVIERAWSARLEAEQNKKDLVNQLFTYDPSVLAAAAKLIQDQAQKRLSASAGKET